MLSSIILPFMQRLASRAPIIASRWGDVPQGPVLSTLLSFQLTRRVQLPLITSPTTTAQRADNNKVHVCVSQLFLKNSNLIGRYFGRYFAGCDPATAIHQQKSCEDLASGTAADSQEMGPAGRVRHVAQRCNNQLAFSLRDVRDFRAVPGHRRGGQWDNDSWPCRVAMTTKMYDAFDFALVSARLCPHSRSRQ